MVMLVTRETVAEKLAAYLQHRITLAQLVDWAENALMEDDFVEEDLQALRKAIRLDDIGDPPVTLSTRAHEGRFRAPADPDGRARPLDGLGIE